MGHLSHARSVVFGNRESSKTIGVLIVLMTSALVVAIWGVARDKLVDIVRSALETVCGQVGC